jgi:hypothetical protein
LHPPELSGLNISWGDLMDMPVGHRDIIAELLNEQRDREIHAHKQAMRSIR